jgi:hypothetical protein
MFSSLISSFSGQVHQLGEVFLSAAIAAWSTLPALLTAAIISAVIGGCVAVAERRSLLPKYLVTSITVLILLTLFYPRQISQSGLTYLTTLIAHAHFAQSAWGLAVVSIPTSAAMAYLIFSTGISIVDVTSLPAQFLKNSASSPFLRTILITTIPVQSMMAAVIAIVYCGITFQAALLGRTGASTVGSYFLTRLSTVEFNYADHLLLAAAACICLMFLLIGVGVLIYLVLRRLSVAAIDLIAVQNVTRRVTNKLLIASFISGVSLLSGLVALILHIFLLLRLLGVAGGIVQWLGGSYGSLESTPPTLSFVATANLLDGTVDVALGGALIGAGLSILLWFVAAQKASRPRRGLWARVTYIFALLAFLPSTFSGAIGLTMPFIKIARPLLMFGWGIVTAFSLTLLLISPQLMNPYLLRYSNAVRICGALRAGSLFLSEYGVLCVGLLIACLVSNALDNGFRDQMGIVSLGTRFLDRQGNWDSNLRGLALLIMVAALLATFALGRRGTSRIPVE